MLQPMTISLTFGLLRVFQTSWCVPISVHGILEVGSRKKSGSKLQATFGTFSHKLQSQTAQTAPFSMQA